MQMSSAIPFHNGLRTPRHKLVISNIERAVVYCREWPVGVYESPNDHELAGEGYPEVNMDKRGDAIRVLIRDPVLQKRLSKYLVQRCFRNSVLDDLHAGIAPDSKAGDYSDVVVSTPFGEIPWSKLSRFDDEEMKTLMIDVVQKTYEFIQELFDVENGGELLLPLAERDPLPRWEDPR